MAFVESILGQLLWFYAACVFVLGLSLTSEKPNLKSVGIFLVVIAIPNAVLGLYAMTLGSFLSATLVLMFAVIFISAGIILVREYGLVPIGDCALFVAISLVWFAYIFAVELEEYMLTYICAMLIIPFLSLTACSRGKLSLKATGWILVIEAFITLLIPSWMYFMGIAPI